jgi:hypothetical protein
MDHQFPVFDPKSNELIYAIPDPWYNLELTKGKNNTKKFLNSGTELSKNIRKILINSGINKYLPIKDNVQKVLTAVTCSETGKEYLVIEIENTKYIITMEDYFVKIEDPVYWPLILDVITDTDELNKITDLLDGLNI